MIINSENSQQTINNNIFFEGSGLHTGINCKLKLIPAPSDYGIIFFIKDNDKTISIPAHIDYVNSTVRGTNLLKDNICIFTVEHLLSALYALGIDNLKIEISSNELPILDGSSKLYLKAIKKIGIKQQNSKRQEFIVNKIISFTSSKGLKFYLLPSNKYKFTYYLDYDNIDYLKQVHTISLENDNYEKEIADAKTFCLLSELFSLYNHGLIKGGTLNNAIVYIDQKLNSEKIKQLNKIFNNKIKINYSNKILNDLNLKDEKQAAKHKILDLIGDSSLFGYKIKGHLIAHQSGHEANVEFIKYLKDNFFNNERINIKKENNKMYNIKQILNIMPHRYPFLLVDKILHLESGKTVTAIKNVTINEPFFLGHFPDKPVMPGVLLLEVMAQAGGFLVLHSIKNPEEKLIYLSSIKSAKFKNTVQPGDQLLIKAELANFKLGTCKINSKIYVDNKLITECELLASVVNRYD